MARASGVLLHISSLWGDYGSGCFGDEAFEWIDFLQKSGFTYWQVLPLGIPDGYYSPYSALTAFGGNPWFVDLRQLYHQGLITGAELEQQRQQQPYLCEFERLAQSRMALLRRAALRVKNRAPIREFILAHPQLASLCRFMALRQAYPGLPWQQWPKAAPDAQEEFVWQFIQHAFFTQWARVHEYAASCGVRIIGDVPIYVGADSADVWAYPQQFELDGAGYPTRVAGVPPDYFAADGQLWGNPLYRWDQMEKDGYDWWSQRLKHLFSLFDGVRIDHFRGLESYWSVPAGASTAREGQWMPGPGLPFCKKIRELAGDKLVIAEDLGEITPQVAQLVRDSGFPGMRVFQFAFLGQDSVHLPYRYTPECVAYSGTHDNNTLLGYLWELDEPTRARVLEYCGHEGPWQQGCRAILRTLFASGADTLILPVQDLLGYGADTRINTPGTAQGNWRYRLAREQFLDIDAARFLRLNALYGRCPKK